MKIFLRACLIMLLGIINNSTVFSQSLQPEQCFEANDELTSSILWSPDGEWIAVAGRDVHLYRTPFEYIKSLGLPEGMLVYGLDWKSDSSQLAVLLHNRVIVWNFITNEIVLDWDVGINHLRHIDWSPDDSKIGISSGENFVGIYYFIDNTSEIIEMDGERGQLGGFEWAWDSRLFALDRTGDMIIYDSQLRERVSWLLGTRHYLVAWRPKPQDYTLLLGTRIMEGTFIEPSNQMVIYSWNFVTRQTDIVGIFIQPSGDFVSYDFFSIEWRPDGNYFATLGGDWKIRIWKLGDLNIHLEFDAIATQYYVPVDVNNQNKIAWRPDGQQLAQATDLGICFWDMSILD